MPNLALHRLLGLALLTLVPVTAHAQQAAQAAPLRGDVNGDGRVTAADAQAVRDHVAGRPAAPGIVLLPNGDANGDGRITGVDAAMIQAFAAGRDVSRFGVGQPIAGGAGGGEQKKNDNLLGIYVCTMDVETNTQSCETPRPQMGASADYLLGKPNVGYVTTGTVSSRGNPADEDTTSMNVAVTNNIGQPIGTVDGTTAAASGVRVFFHDGPRVTSVKSGTLASATIRLEGTDGIADFAGPEGEFPKTNKPFYQYTGVLATGATSAPKGWKFVYSANTKTYTYSVQVSAPMQYEFGKINIAPTSLVLGESEASSALTPTVLNPLFAVVSEGVTWSSSNTAVATVDASGVVTGVAQGTATITATSQVKAQRKGTIPVTVDQAPTVVSTIPADNATQVAGTSNIEITFSEAVDVTTSSFTLECPAGTAKSFTVSGSGTAVVTLDPDADLPAGTICTVKVIGAQVSDTDTNDGPNTLAGGDRAFSFEVNIQAVADAFATTTTGNVRINSASTSPAFSITANDQLNPANTTITFAGWNGVGGKTQQGGDVAVTTSGEGMGQFTYNPPAGFEGTDSLEYTITSGSASASAKVALPVSGMIWFVNNGGAACTSRANGCGRLTNPYSTLAAFHAENNGTGNNPAANEAIFVYQSSTAYTGPVTLLNGQKLIGQDATATLQALSGITPATGSDALPAMDAAGDAATIAGTDGVNLGTGNTLRGLTLAPTAGEAIGGASFGTLTLSTGTPDLIVNAGGQALSLTTGAITGTFTSVASAGGTNNVLLSGVTGDIDFGAGALSGSTGGAIKIVGGPLTLDASGNITQAAAAPLLDVSGAHTGTLTFTGTLNATAGTGLQFSDADGVYSFGGTTTLNGGDAGIDIIAAASGANPGSSGTFTFSANTLVQSPTGTAFNVNGSTPNVTFNGSLIRTANSALLVDITNMASGSITFDPAAGTDSLYATIGDGIQLSNADGAVDFNARVRLAGGNAGVDIINGSTGNIDFDAASIVNPSGEALRIFNASGGNSATDVSFAGSISTNAGRPVLVEGVGSGTVAVSASVTATGQGAAVQNNSGGTITFSNATQTLNTGVNAAVTLSNNAGSTVNFTGGTLALSTTSGAGFSATGGGTVNVTGTANTVASTSGGTAVKIENTTIGGSGVTFYRVSTTGAANGILLSSTGSGSFTVSGDGASDGGNTTRGRTTSRSGGGSIALGSGGTISSTTGDGVSLTNAQNVTLRNLTISGAGGSAVDGTKNGIDAQSVTNLTVDNTYITGSAGNSGLYASSVSGLTLTHVEINNNATTSGVEDGLKLISNVDLTNVTGALTISNSVIANSRLNALDLNNSSGTVNAVVSNSEFHNALITGRGNNAFSVEGHLTANISTNITGSSFHDVAAKGFQYVSDGSAGGGTLTIATSSFEMSNSAISISHGGQGGTDLKFNINNNRIRQATADLYSGDGVSTTSTAIIAQLNSASAVGADLIGFIQNNLIGASTTSKASATGFGINVDHYGQGNATIQVSGNVIKEIGSSSAAGIFWGMGVCSTATSANCSTRVGNLTVIGNDVLSTGNGLSGINVANGTNLGDAGTLCLNIGSNNAASPQNTRFSVPAGTGRRGVRVSVNHGGVTRLQNYSGATYISGPATDANTFLNSTQVSTIISPNTLAPVVFGTTDTGRKIEPAASACATPVL